MEDWVKQLQDYAATALRPLEGKVELKGLESDVEILTDRWGVPHVYAQSREDLYFAQGYLHATERLWQVELTVRLAQGRLSEILGPLTLPLDRFFRTLGLGRTALHFVNEMDEVTTRIGESYYQGFRAGAESVPLPVEYQIIGAQPSIPSSFEEAQHMSFSIAMLMAFTLSANWEFEIIRVWLADVLGPERARQLAPFVDSESPGTVAPPEATGIIRDLARIMRGVKVRTPGTGSNNWVVSGAKSATGLPLLANDPHLRIQMPSIWMETHLSAPDMEVTGVTLPGVPCVLIGHNQKIAWGLTNTGADVVDLYVEKLSEDGAAYEFEGKLRPVEVIREEIRVLHQEPETLEVRTTHHGPLVSARLEGNLNFVVKEGAIDPPVAFRWIHYEVFPTIAGLEGMNLASNWDEFRDAAKKWPSAGQNIVYADIDGNIGYQFTGTVPIRPAGVIGAVPLPGWTGEHEWEGTIPFDELPSTFNPECGYIATANHRVVDADYPYYLTHDWELPHRIRRITSLLTEKEKLARDDFERLQFDTHSGVAEELLPLLLAAPVIERKAADALAAIQQWDLQMDADSPGAAIFVVWTTKIAEALFRPRLGDELFEAYFLNRSWTTLWGYEVIRDVLEHPESYWVGGDGSDNRRAADELIAKALADAVTELESRLGPDADQWRWGRLHQVHFRHPLATAMPPLDELMSIGPLEAPGGDDTVNRGVFSPGEEFGDAAVSSYRQIVDLSNFDDSVAIITTGNSGNPASPHYRDQSELWVKGDYHPMLFSREAVERATTGRLLLVP